MRNTKVVLSPLKSLIDVGASWYDFRDDTLDLYAGWTRSIGKSCVRIATKQEVRARKRTLFFGLKPKDKNYTLVELVLFGTFTTKR